MSDRSPGEADPPVVVYRVVDATELSYLEDRGHSGSNPSQSGKYFALTTDGARAFANAPMNAGTTITITALPQSVIDQGTRFNDLRALNLATDNTAAKLAEPVPCSCLVELHAPDCAGRIVAVDEAVARLYLGDDHSYRVIDVAVLQVRPGATLAFVRVSGHAPAGFDHTFNPSGPGPFKPILAEHVTDRRVHSG